jgi:hypothetical protein
LWISILEQFRLGQRFFLVLVSGCRRHRIFDVFGTRLVKRRAFAFCAGQRDSNTYALSIHGASTLFALLFVFVLLANLVAVGEDAMTFRLQIFRKLSQE